MNNITFNFDRSGEGSISISRDHSNSIITSQTPTVLSDHNSVTTKESKKIKALIHNEIMNQMASTGDWQQLTASGSAVSLIKSITVSESGV